MEEEKKDSEWVDQPKIKQPYRHVPRALRTKEEAEEYAAVLRELYKTK